MPGVKKLEGDRGQAMVEFALIAPVLLLMLWGVIMFAILFKNWIVFTDAVRAAARDAAVCRFHGGDFSAATSHYNSAVGSPNINSVPGETFTPSAISFNTSCVSGTTVTVSASMPYSISFFGYTKSSKVDSSIAERIE